MPTLIILDGIKISIYPSEHNPPHIHVDYTEYHALLDITNLTLLKGEIPGKIFKKAVEWAALYQANLLNTFKELNPHLR